jgi:FkbM family methyltransferase
MNISSFVTKVVIWAAKVYMRMPIRPFGSGLGRLYSTYINSDNGRSIVRKKIDGIHYELDLREVIDYAMYFEGTREPETSSALKILCKHGHVVFDIGANVGSHSLPIASYVGQLGKVYAFEPVPWAVSKLKRNLELNKFNNVILETIALSDVNEQEVEMSFRASFKIGSKSGVGQDGKIDDGWWSECEHVKVRMQTIDSYVLNNHLSQIDLIKLDVDGFEGKVIRGALATLRRFQPILIMEIAPAWTEMRGDNMMDILFNLEQIGYKFYAEKDFSLISNISQLIESLPPDGGVNVVASVHNLA